MKIEHIAIWTRDLEKLKDRELQATGIMNLKR